MRTVRRLGEVWTRVGFGVKVAAACGGMVVTAHAQLPEAPTPSATAVMAADTGAEGGAAGAQVVSPGIAGEQAAQGKQSVPPAQGPVGADGRPIRPQTGRVFGILPNFVSVSGGTKPKPAGWKTDFAIANKQNYDYSAFGFLLISSGLAYAQDSHPSFNTYHGGDAVFWAYLWRGFVDKTDSVYQGTFFFPALLHEDTRYSTLR